MYFIIHRNQEMWGRWWRGSVNKVIGELGDHVDFEKENASKMLRSLKLEIN